jgi:hypothetical protein
MHRRHIRVEVVRREPIDRQRLVRAVVEAVRTRQRQRAAVEQAGEPKENPRKAQDE